jgi:hypothetical protein
MRSLAIWPLSVTPTIAEISSLVSKSAMLLFDIPIERTYAQKQTNPKILLMHAAKPSWGWIFAKTYTWAKPQGFEISPGDGQLHISTHVPTQHLLQVKVQLDQPFPK